MARSRLRGFGWSEKNCSPRDPPCEESFSKNRAIAIGLYPDSAIRCDPVKSAWLSAVRENLSSTLLAPNPIPSCPRRPNMEPPATREPRSEEHTSELQSLTNLVCRLLLEKKQADHDRS